MAGKGLSWSMSHCFKRRPLRCPGGKNQVEQGKYDRVDKTFTASPVKAPHFRLYDPEPRKVVSVERNGYDAFEVMV